MTSSVWNNHLSRLLVALFPSPCLACDELAPEGLRGLGLCAACRGSIRPLRPPLCRTCSQPLAAAHAPPGFVCVTCRAVPSPLDELVALWNYESPVDAVIRGLKFSRLPQLAIPLGLELAERLRRRELVVDLVATVPLHWRRRLVRGYDQSEEIARTVATRLGVSLGRPLRRCRATTPQSSLPRNRRTANLASAFQARRPNRLSAAHVLLVDDVVTSGATLRAAALRLKKLGVQKVTAAVVARTPAPGEVACPGNP